MKKLMLALTVVAGLSLWHSVELTPWQIAAVQAASPTDKTLPVPGPAPSARCKAQCATANTACIGRCSGPNLERCEQSCQKAYEDCVKKCDSLPTSLRNQEEDLAHICLVF